MSWLEFGMEEAETGYLSTPYLKLYMLWKWAGSSLWGRSAGRAARELEQAEADPVYSLGFNYS